MATRKKRAAPARPRKPRSPARVRKKTKKARGHHHPELWGLGLVVTGLILATVVWLGWDGGPVGSQVSQWLDDGLGAAAPLVPAILIGIGGAVAVEAGLAAGRRVPPLRRALLGGLALAVGLGLAVAAWQGQQAVRGWVAMHAGFQASEQSLAALVESATRATGQAGTPHVVCFGTTPALYHYTHWPIRDLYSYDEADLAAFLQTAAPRLVVVPETSLATQWAGTPSGARWAWLRAHYPLRLQGREGDFAVYTVEAGP